MSPVVGWALATATLALGWLLYDWRGLVVGFTLVVFWLVLQFNRSVRVMRGASGAPIGSVDSAVMLHAKLRRGMQMMQVLGLTKSLGRRVGETGDVYAWVDAGGAEVVVTFHDGRCTQWALQRPAEPTA